MSQIVDANNPQPARTLFEEVAEKLHALPKALNNYEIPFYTDEHDKFESVLKDISEKIDCCKRHGLRVFHVDISKISPNAVGALIENFEKNDKLIVRREHLVYGYFLRVEVTRNNKDHYQMPDDLDEHVLSIFTPKKRGNFKG